MNADLIQRKKRCRQRMAMGAAALPVALLALAGCGRGQAPMGAMPPPQVGVITVEPRALAITNDLPGRINPVQIAQVNARVDGVVLKREFEQGADVKAGQVLYEIDPAPYQASLDSAKASVAQAQANETQTELLAERYKPLIGINAVSQQNYDNAVSAAAQAKASVAAAQAAEKTAEINLGYCTVTAPIAGRIGPALVTEGALVSASAATEMAVIQQMDPVYFDFTEASAEALKLRQELEDGQLTKVADGEANVTLTLPDGTPYSQGGKLLFSDITVNPSSGMITLRAEFPNPEGLLLPGMFAVGRVAQAISPKALLVPQPAVVIAPDGTASVMLVTPANQLATQPIQIGGAVGSDWMVNSGLKAGDVVVVDGIQKVTPGMTVSPVPVETATNSTAGSGK
ncbi:MAG: efflux RND transporter periplasmic adaptor subunit [Limisphaerales bacterium]